MVDDDTDAPETEADGEAVATVMESHGMRSHGWRHRVRLVAGIAVVVAISVFGAGPMPSRHIALAPIGADIPDPRLKMDWKSVGAYVADGNMTDSMTASERLKYDAQQIQLLQAKENKVIIPTIKAPLLPGPVQQVKVTVPSNRHLFSQTPEDAANATQPTAEPVAERTASRAESREQQFNADMSTLEALKNALKAMNAEKQTTVDQYNADKQP